MHPSADLNLIGLKTERTYFRGLLDFAGVEPEFVRKSEYKSSPESFLNHGSSESNHEQSKALLDDLSNIFHKTIAKNRNLTEDSVVNIVHEGPYSAQEALSKKLIDGLKYPDEIKENRQVNLWKIPRH